MAWQLAIDKQLTRLRFVAHARHSTGTVVGYVDERSTDCADHAGVAVSDGCHELRVIVGEVAAAIAQYGLDRGDHGVDVGGLCLGACGALLGQDLVVLALLCGVAAVLLL